MAGGGGGGGLGRQTGWGEVWAPSTGSGPGVPDSPEADPPCAGRGAGGGQ